VASPGRRLAPESRRSAPRAPPAQPANGARQVVEPAHDVGECRNAGPVELRAHIRRGPVDHHEIRAQPENLLDVRVEQRANPHETLHLGRPVVEAAHGDDVRSRTDGEEHLGDRGDNRHDASGRGASRRAARGRSGRLPARADDRGERQAQQGGERTGERLHSRPSLLQHRLDANRVAGGSVSVSRAQHGTGQWSPTRRRPQRPQRYRVRLSITESD
jgi:hypothetical protein